MMQLLAPIDNYCERVNPELWAEPLNAASNLAFLLAAYFLYRLYMRQPNKLSAHRMVIALIATVGVGSFLFHTFANNLTMLADVIPIAIFVYYAIWQFCRMVFRLNSRLCLLYLLVLTLSAAVTSFAPPSLHFNGSILYAPCLAALLFITLALYGQNHPGARNMLLCCVVFLISLICRTIDLQICDAWPLGTHFLWHSLNGIVLYLIGKTLIQRKYH